jgi:hypothetical protein
MDTKITVSEQFGWRFEVRWILLALAGLIASIPLVGALVVAATLIFWITGANEKILDKFDFGIVGIEISIGAMVGFIQWLALRRVIKTKISWVLANVIGFAISSSIQTLATFVWKLPGDMVFPLGVLGLAIGFVVGGMLSGVMQQRILRHHVRHSGWWVPASAIGWGLGLIGFAAGFAILHPILPKPASPLIGIPVLMGLLTLGSVFYGIVTGWTLIWLLRQPK